MISRVLARFVPRKFSISCKTVDNFLIKGPNPDMKPLAGFGSVFESIGTGKTFSTSDKSKKFIGIAGVAGMGVGMYIHSQQQPPPGEEIPLQVHDNWPALESFTLVPLSEEEEWSSDIEPNKDNDHLSSSEDEWQLEDDCFFTPKDKDLLSPSEDEGQLEDDFFFTSKDKVWELKLTCRYSEKDRKLQLWNMSMRGLWPARIVNGEVEYICNGVKEISVNIPTARKLLGKLAIDYPNIKYKMGKFWISRFHTLDPEDNWVREISERGTMDYLYWIKAVQVATPFFYDDGRCMFIDWMKQWNYVHGKFSCRKFEDDMSRQLGKRVRAIYRRMIDKKIYLFEIGILFDDSFNMINYPPHKIGFQEFVLERHEELDYEEVILETDSDFEELRMMQQDADDKDQAFQILEALAKTS